MVGKLYACCSGARAVTSEDIVPSDTQEGKTVIHQGRNSLPLFNDQNVNAWEVESLATTTSRWHTIKLGFFVVREAHPESMPEERTRLHERSGRLSSEWPKFAERQRPIKLVYKNTATCATSPMVSRWVKPQARKERRAVFHSLPPRRLNRRQRAGSRRMSFGLNQVRRDASSQVLGCIDMHPVAG